MYNVTILNLLHNQVFEITSEMIEENLRQPVKRKQISQQNQRKNNKKKKFNQMSQIHCFYYLFGLYVTK